MTATDAEPRRGPGRPRKVSTVTKQEYIDDGTDDDETKDDGFAGLFDDETLKTISRVRVIRKEPNEGTVGYLEDPTMGEAEIAERWGGSTYQVQGIDGRGMLRKSTTIKIAGDPIFVSTVAEMQWRRSRGLPMNTAPAAAAAAPAMTMQEIMVLMQAADERRRTEERESQERLRKIELEAAAQRRKEETEYADRVRRETIEQEARARRDEEERDRRRAKDEEEREARRRRDQQEAEARQQQFMQQTIQMLQQSSNQALQFVKATAAEHRPEGNNLMDAVKTVVAIKEAFAGEGDGGEETPMNLLIKHGAEWVSGLSNGVAGAIREIKSGGVNGGAVAPATSSPHRALPTTGPASPLALLPANHPLNEKVETLVAKLAAKGLDPIAAMDTIVTNVLADVERIPQQNQPAKPEPFKPYVQGPVGVAQNAPIVSPVAAPAVDDKPAKVIRLSFARG